jgi:hypothetical protein
LNTIKFHETITAELIGVKDRVRILANHWGEDGKYKEVILKNIIERFLPEQYKIGTGFIVKETSKRNTHQSSSQIDLIIYDTKYPVLFKEGDFVIVTADAVAGIIEVKTNLEKAGLKETIEKSNIIGKFISDARKKYKVKTRPIFNGIFSYEGYDNIDINVEKANIKNIINHFGLNRQNDNYKVNHISINQDILYKFWLPGSPYKGGHLLLTKKLSFSFFISNLMAHLFYSTISDNSHLWFPVNKKEFKTMEI